MKQRKEGADMRFPGEPYCSDCPDTEACHQGAACFLVRIINRHEPKDLPQEETEY